MNEKEVLLTIIKRLKEEYIRPLLQEKKASDFNDGVLLGFSGSMTVIKNSIATILGEECLKEYGIDIDCDTFYDI